MGFQDNINLAVKVGLITAEQGSQWLDDLQAADRQGLFFSAYTGFIVAGVVHK